MLTTVTKEDLSTEYVDYGVYFAQLALIEMKIRRLKQLPNAPLDMYIVRNFYSGYLKLCHWTILCHQVILNYSINTQLSYVHHSTYNISWYYAHTS